MAVERKTFVVTRRVRYIVKAHSADTAVQIVKDATATHSERTLLAEDNNHMGQFIAKQTDKVAIVDGMDETELQNIVRMCQSRLAIMANEKLRRGQQMLADAEKMLEEAQDA